MSKCAKCGLEAKEGDLTLSGVCPGVDVLACRDRQVAAQSALLKSVTGKLEQARALIEDDASPEEAAVARDLLDSALKELS